MIDIGSKYIHSEEIDKAYGKPVYAIINKSSGAPIAQIGWYPSWRRYVLSPMQTTAFDVSCLECITKFMKGLK